MRSMGIYLVVDTTVGLILMWDKKTSIFIKLSPSFQVHFKIQNLNKMISERYAGYLSKKKNGNLGCNQKTEIAATAYYYPCSVDLDWVLHIFLKLHYSAMA